MRINRPRGKTKLAQGLDGTRTRHSVGNPTGVGQSMVIHSVRTTQITFGAGVFHLDYDPGGYTSLPTVPQHTFRSVPPATAPEWVERNLKKVQAFPEQWVAITERGIIAHSRTFDGVYGKAKDKGVTNPLVFKVPKPTSMRKVVSGHIQ